MPGYRTQGSATFVSSRRSTLGSPSSAPLGLVYRRFNRQNAKLPNFKSCALGLIRVSRAFVLNNSDTQRLVREPKRGGDSLVRDSSLVHIDR